MATKRRTKPIKIQRINVISISFANQTLSVQIKFQPNDNGLSYTYDEPLQKAHKQHDEAANLTQNEKPDH